MQASVSTLKQHLEQLFPGKWLTGAERSSNLLTGVPEIDKGITRGIARKRISQWTGPISSGKTSLLRTAVINWCAAGLNVAYIDTEGKLFAPDWSKTASAKGKFWIVRPPEPGLTDPTGVLPLVSKPALVLQEAIWSTDQFIRCNAFDVVILDLGGTNPFDNRRRGMAHTGVPSRIYARLQRSLDRSKSALIVVRDAASEVTSVGDNWGTSAKFNFDWGTSIKCESGLAGNIMITPAIKCSIEKDGLSQTVEVSIASSVKNRMFTHPQVPDRRTSKK